MNEYRTKRKKAKMRTVSKNYVDYVVQDCPIMGKSIARHYLNETKMNNYDRNRK